MPGEIHALVGENGAGKSTLAAIAYGSVTPDSGTIHASGVVGLVHQHFKLIDRLRVWENVLLGREPKRGFAIDVAVARTRVLELCATYGLELDPDARIESLPIAVRQRVELVRELQREPAVLLLDEPTAALAPSEIDAFFATIRALAARGTAIVIVTHKLNEVITHADRVTVMRAGKIVASMRVAETNVAAIARAMVGGDLPLITPHLATTLEPALQVERLTAGSGAGALVDASFAVRAGEIVGIAGIEGNGQSALADALAGVIDYSGRIALAQTELPARVSPAARLRLGMRSIPQDRHTEALVLEWSVADNAALGFQRTLRGGALVDRARTTAFAQSIVERYDVRPPNPNARIGALSGGNQQKVVVGRALESDPQFVLAYQPTRGIDIGAAALVQSRLIEARNAGVAVLLISFELDEILTLADRVLVMYGGSIVGTFERGALDRSRIGALMAGTS